jgi:hypothetical protein
MDIKDKLKYVANYRKADGDFIQYWPDENGNFNFVSYCQDILGALVRGENPVVPAGATKMKLSDRMKIRIEQARSIPISDELSEVLNKLEIVIRSL